MAIVLLGHPGRRWHTWCTGMERHGKMNMELRHRRVSKAAQEPGKTAHGSLPGTPQLNDAAKPVGRHVYADATQCACPGSYAYAPTPTVSPKNELYCYVCACVNKSVAPGTGTWQCDICSGALVRDACCHAATYHQFCLRCPASQTFFSTSA